MSKERIKSLQLEIEKEREHIDSLTNNLQEKNEQLISKEKELEELMSAGRFYPQVGEDYWYIESCGEIDDDRNHDLPTDHRSFNFGNCFPTEEAAIKRRDFMQFLTDNNLWDKVEERVRLQVELEAFAKEVAYPLEGKSDYYSLDNCLRFREAKTLNLNYTYFNQVSAIYSKFGFCTKTIFEPLT